MLCELGGLSQGKPQHDLGSAVQAATGAKGIHPACSAHRNQVLPPGTYTVLIRPSCMYKETLGVWGGKWPAAARSNRAIMDHCRQLTRDLLFPPGQICAEL